MHLLRLPAPDLYAHAAACGAGMSDALRVALCVAAGAVVGAWLTMSLVEYWEWSSRVREESAP